MREIKFRAIPNKEASSHNYPISYFTLEDCMRHKVSFGYPEHFVFNQFTGLLDKHGKDIYEGDIMKVLDRDWVDKEKETKVVKVVFERGSFWLKNYGDINKEYGRDVFEIIGNIYENPELLK